MNKPSQCSGCPLEKKGAGFCKASSDPATAKLAVLFDAPEEADIYSGSLWGGTLEGWILPAIGLHRKDILLDSVLRCLPPKGKTGRYPVGIERIEAEAACRAYDIWSEYKPTVGIVTMDLYKLRQEPIPLPLVIEDFKKARDFQRAGERPVLLAGDKAANYWFGMQMTPHRWRGHYGWNDQLAEKVRSARLV